MVDILLAVAGLILSIQVVRMEKRIDALERGK